jgi:hypothetical protein
LKNSVEIGSKDLKYDPIEEPILTFPNEFVLIEEDNDDEIDEEIEFLKTVYKLLSYEF